MGRTVGRAAAMWTDGSLGEALGRCGCMQPSQSLMHALNSQLFAAPPPRSASTLSEIPRTLFATRWWDLAHVASLQ